MPQLVLTSKLIVNEANHKGAVELDWSSYDTSNKYFVIYRKQEGETEWREIVGLEKKFTGNKYIDKLANDIQNSSIPEINIEKDVENNDIKITSNSIDIGTKYSYYIESYDNTGTLIDTLK